MLGNQHVSLYQTSRFFQEKVCLRKAQVSKTLDDICKIVQDILKEVESQEPRFISTLVENQGRYEGVHPISPSEFEVILYLNQMGVFNFVDDGSVPGCAVLKLSDGRKRSMSLWVEFITASGYLSARKIRSRFQTLVAQAVDKSQYRDIVKMIPDTSEVRIRIHDKFVVQITTSFRCTGIWPRSASHWPVSTISWPGPNMVAEVKSEGFDLYSKEPTAGQSGKSQSSMEGDAWAMSFTQAEDMLLSHSARPKCLSILKSLRDAHLELPGGGSPINNYIIKTLVLFECEKHPLEEDWADGTIGDRMIGVLLQLVSCLQCRKCPHYFIPTMDLLKGRAPAVLDQACKATWALLRSLMLNPRALELL